VILVLKKIYNKMERDQWSQFKLRVNINAPADQVYNSWATPGELIVQLVESGVPLDDDTAMKHFVGDSRGWIFYLANLKPVLEGGLDLRNKRMELTNVITA
jgi:hypothetical protein